MEARKNNTRGRHSMGPHYQGRARHPLNGIRIQLVTLVVSMLVAGSASSGEDLGTNIGMASISLDGPGLLMVECLGGKILEPYEHVTFTPGQWYLYGFQREGFANGVIQHYTPVENVSAIQHDLHALCLKEYRHFQDLDPVPIKSLRWVSRNPHLHPYQQVRANTTSVLCTKEGLLSPEDVTGAEYSGWYILKATFLGKDSRNGLRVRTYFDRPIPVKGTLKAYCMLRDSQMIITRESSYVQGHVSTDYLRTSIMMLKLNCSDSDQAIWNDQSGPVKLEGLYRATVLKVRTDAKDPRYTQLKGSPSIRSFMITIMRDNCVPEVTGYYFVTYAHWEQDTQMVMLDTNPWRWDLVCNGVDTPTVDVWMDGTPMTEEYRGRYVSSDWTDPRGRDINFDINIDGSFKWPFCEAADEGCWTFTQWVYLSQTKPVGKLVLQAGEDEQWYPFKGRGQVCVTVVRVPYETEGLQPVRPHSDSCTTPIHQLADPVAPQLSSPWKIITDAKFILFTWRISVDDFRVDHWDHRCEEFVRNQIDMVRGWIEAGQEVRKDDSRLRKNRGRRDLVAMGLGGGALGVGALNTMDMEVLRSKLGEVARHAGEGFKTQIDVDHVLEGLQHSHIDATTSLSSAIREKFRRLVVGLLEEQDRAQLALACTQVQSELSDNLKHIVTALHNGHFPFNLRQRISPLISPFAINHTNWWVVQWHGCQNLTCTASSLAPVSGRIRQGYSVINLGTMINNQTVLHPQLPSGVLTYEEGHPSLFDTEGCRIRENAILCQGSRERTLRHQCWNTEGSCEMKANPMPSSSLKYLGQGYWCWYQGSDPSYAIFGLNCTERGTLRPGAYCTLSPVLGLNVAEQQGRTPITPEKRLDIRPDVPVRLQKIPLGFGKELRHLLMDFNQEEEIVQRLRETEKQATIQLTHDRTKITAVATALDKDSKVSWWESLFGYSPKATSFFNLLIHPVIVLLALVGLMYLGLWWMYRRVKRLTDQLNQNQTALHEVNRRRLRT
ncbi:uncharacterized protein LOC122930579 [Bufo gargarizans]|uniref:uncharacterized protein LOC122930579 n=1 Tax=Bufo gargarizans TaxID=30331 RepID=UPI001CF2E3B4|nr:uncharacterized protein LOC122930579 [Bufo gargarizans]